MKKRSPRSSEQSRRSKRPQGRAEKGHVRRKRHSKNEIASEAQFFAGDPRAMPDLESLNELLAIEGVDNGHLALSALTKEAWHLWMNFGWPYQNALYLALAMRGVLEPYKEWRQNELDGRSFLERLSESNPDALYMPTTLYKYMRLDSKQRLNFARQLLLKGELYLASPSSLNDPDDCIPPPLEPHIRLLHEGREMEESLFTDYVQVRVGIASFSEDNGNDLMWAHYADGERGICVEIDVRHVLSKEQRKHIVLLPVTYVPSVRLFGSDELSETRNAISQLTVKRPSWSYEREWRLTKMWMTPAKAPQRRLHLGEALVRAVFVGRRTTASTRKKVESWASSRKISMPIMDAPIS